MALSLAAGAPTFARAQVLEIEPDGSVVTFDGPAGAQAPGAAPVIAHPATRGRHPASLQDYRRAAAASNLSRDLIAAVALRESHFHAGAVSPKGALGEMQLMPATARWLGVDAADGAQNVRGGAAYLSALLRRYDGDLQKALAAYNAGPTAVDRYGGVPPFKETQAYVAAVLDHLSQVVLPATPSAKSRR